jgi:TetR/AcrR family transcriptional regulator, ethionamide resistance regulator
VRGDQEEYRRRRRTPEQAEAEIVTAAEALLRERPFRELTVDEVMRRTELSRPSFYVYFRDRHHLVLRVVERIGAELFTLAERWFKGGRDGPAEIRAALEGIVDAFRDHGPVLRALSDAARDDPRVEEVYGGLVRRFAEATRQHIRDEQAAGNALALDPDETARALMYMGERYLLETLGQPSSTSPATVTTTLTTIWTRTLYGQDPPTAPPPAPQSSALSR